MTDTPTSLSDLTERSRAIFRELVDAYLETGEPIGSRTLSKRLKSPLSSASIRNVMQDLEVLGLLDSPHISAGRRPTHEGLRLFVDGMMEVGGPSEEERRLIEEGLGTGGSSLETALAHAGGLLSGLAGAASLVFVPQSDSPIKHIDFIALSDRQALVVLVKEDGQIENRLIDSPLGLTPSAMHEAANYLNERLRGLTLDQARDQLVREIDDRNRELSDISLRLIDAGLATWEGAASDDDIAPERLIVRGRAHLLEDAELSRDVDRMRQLFEDLELKKDLAQLINLTDQGDGVRVFIGAENKLFSLTGSSLVISPYMNAEQSVVGAVGVIGPTRMNYGRIVPIVDYTATLIGRMMSDKKNTGG
jgi:heat-inducible transcriptional repressor